MSKAKTKNELQVELEQAHKRIAELDAAEEKLRESEECHRALVESLDVSLCRWLTDTTLTYANEKYRQIFGVQDDALGQKWINFLPEETRASTAAFYREVAKSPRTVTYEHLVTVENGSLRHYHWIDTPILDKNGNVLEFQSVGIDITDRKQAEQVMAESEAHTRELLEATPDAIVIIDTDGKILMTNVQTEKMFGYAQKELVGAAVETLIPNSLRDWHMENRAKFMEQPRPVITGGNREIFGLRQSGEEFPVEVSLSHHKLAGGEAVVLCAIRDVTERARSAALIAAQRDLAKLANTHMPKEEMWDFCMKQVVRVSGLDSGGIYFFNEHSHALELIHHQGLGAEFIAAVSLFEEDDPSTQMLLKGGTVFATESDLQIKSYHRAEGLRSLVVVPIQHHGQILGCLNIASHTLPGIPDWSRNALETVAVEIGNIIIHQRMEDSLQANREQLSQALLTASMGTWRYHVATARIDWSPEAASIFGIESQKNDFSAILTKFHPDDRERAVAMLQEALIQKKILRMEYRMFDAEGNTRWVTNYGHVECDAKGNPLTLVGLVHDITERKKMADELEAESVRRRILFEESPDGILTIDPKTAGFLEFNGTAHTQLGYTREEFSRLHIFDVEVHETTDEIRAHIGNLIQNGRSDFETLQRTKQGEIRNVYVTAQVVEILGQPVYYCTWRDITERKRAEEARRESDERYHLLFQTMVQGVVFQDGEGRIIQANPAAEKILGLTVDQMMGRNSVNPRWHTVHEDGSDFPDEMHPAIIALKTGQPVYNVMIGVFNPCREAYMWLNVNAVPRFMDGGTKPYQVYTTFEDITERKLYENALIASEKKLKSVIDSQTHFVIRVNMEGKYSYWNAQFEKEFGWLYQLEGMKNAHVMTAVCKYHHEHLREVVAKCIAQPGQVFSVEIDKPARDGGIRTSLWEFICLTDERNQPIEIQCMGVEITDRKQAEQALRFSEAKWRSLFETCPVGIALGNTQGKFLDINPAYLAQLGYTHDEMAKKRYEDITPPKWHAQEAQNVAQLKATGLPMYFEKEHIRKDGTVFPVALTGWAIRDESGAPSTLGVFVQDISDRKHAEEALRESERKISTLLSNLIGFAYRCQNDRNWTMEYISSGCEAITGYAPDDLIGNRTLKFNELIHPADSESVWKSIQDALKAQTPFQLEYRITTREGVQKWVWEQGRGIFEGETLIALEGFITDISERKLAEKKLQASEARAQAMLNAIPDMMFRLNREGVFLDYKAETSELYAQSEPTLIGKRNQDVSPPEFGELINAKINETLEAGKLSAFEYELEIPVSGLRSYEARMTPSGSDEVIAVVRDITERKLAEEALNKSQALLTEAQRIGRTGHMEWNGRGQSLICSDEVYAILGVSHDTVITQNTIAAMMTPGEHERIQQMDMHSIQQRTDMNYEYRIRVKDGSERWIHQMGRVTYNENGTPIRKISIIQDVTERKQTEEILRENRLRIEMALKGANAAMWDWNVQTGETVFNERWAEILGYTMKELEPVSIQTWTDLCHPDDLKISNVLLQKHFNGETEYYECEARMRHKSGSWIWVIDRGKVMEWDAECKPVRMFGTHLDITVTKREELYIQARLNLANLSYELLDMETLMRTMLDEAEALTDSTIGFFHFVDNDQNTISLQAWSTNTINTLCSAAGKGLHYPVAQAGVWADGIRSGEPRIYNDYARLAHRHQLPEGHAPVIRLITLPIKRNNLVVAAIGVGNKPVDYDEHDLEMIKRLAEDAFNIILRKRAEESLRESEEKYRGLMESLNNAISTVDPDGVFLYMNDMAAERLGGMPQELIGKNMMELFPEPIAARQLAAIQTVFQTDKVLVLEAQSVGKDGLRWYRFALHPLHDETGQVEQVLVNVTDIHDLKIAQQDLLELNRTLEEKVNQRTAEVQDLYENAPTGYHSLDINGSYVLVNQTELNWLGYTREEMIGHAIRDFMTEASRKIYREKFPLFLQRGWSKDIEIELFCKDGSILPVIINSTAIHDSDGNFVMSRSTILDITDRKQAERALRENEEQNRLLFEESPSPIALLDGIGHIIRANRAYEQLTGMPRSELYGKTAEEMGLVDSELTTRLTEVMVEAMLRQENFAILEHPLTSADGIRKTVESRIYLLSINSITHILVTTNDISTHKKAEETLRHANLELERAMLMKDEFLATMSHELRTPLTGILGLSEAMQLEIYGALNERQVKTVKNIENSGRHLLELINDVLDLSKVEAGKLELQIELCSLEEICQASLHLTKGMAHQRLQHVNYSAPIDHILLDMDSRRIKQVIVNLISNAIKFTPENGELGLTVEPDEANRQVRLVVWDKGIGIKTEHLPRLFKPFTQIDSSLAREYSGTGLGLALVRRLVELHNGSVKVESVFGEGSRFIVTLPWISQTALIVSSDAEGDEESQTGMVYENISQPLILITDDNQVLLDMLADFLEAKKYRTAKAQSGRELLEKIEGMKPDAILMDIQMPDMDGLETIRRVRNHKDTVIASTPIIAVTALAMPGDHERCLEAGANDYISKPVKLKDLLETLEHLIRGLT